MRAPHGVAPLPDPYSAQDESDDEETGVRAPNVFQCCACCYFSTYFLGVSCCCFCCVIFTLGALTLAINRNYSCLEDAVQGIPPAFDGQLMPRQVKLVEYWNQGFQFTKRIDVFDPNDNDKKLGYFYDMNFLFFMRFGFSDASDRIWFEAKRPWFRGAGSISEWWRRHVYEEEHYYLQRCDDYPDIYDIDEDTSVRPWWCQASCMKVLNVSKQVQDSPQHLPEARVHFNYTLEWYFSGFKTREAWNMKMTDAYSKTPIASAHQSFTLQNYFLSWNQRWISHWLVDIGSHETNLPNWVIVFMAALDDIDEASEDGKAH